MSRLTALLEQLAAAPKPERPHLSVKDRLGMTDRAIAASQRVFEPERFSFTFGRSAVQDSPDLERILGLPRRPVPSLGDQSAMAGEMTLRLRRDNPACRCRQLRPNVKNPCIKTLKPVQGWYLYEAAKSAGAMGHIVVGGGKTGIDILLPMVVPGCQRAVLLIPPALRKQFVLDFEVWSQHFRTPNRGGGSGLFDVNRPVLEVLAYSELSTARFATYLRSIAPDVIIADEGQNLKDANAVRTSRFLRYFEEAENVLFFVHSGSLTTRGLADYAHLSALALKENSPLPIDPSTTKDWGLALDPEVKGPRAPIGALRKLCREGQRARDGFRERLLHTPGAISTEDARLGVKLTVHKRSPEVPKEVRELLYFVRSTKKRPDGEELLEEMEIATVARQVAAGFYYFWRYPTGHVLRENGQPEEDDLKRKVVIDQWFDARQCWFRELRQKLEMRREFMDSPKLCTDAAKRFYESYSGPLPKWEAIHWPAWADIKDRVSPVQATKWVDDFLVKDAVAWGKEKPGIIWFLHSAFGQHVAELGGFKLYGSGTNPELEADGSETIVCSIKAHGTGKNLQHAFWRNLIANLPSDGGIWEQLIGRTYRDGQERNVEVHLYQHTTEMVAAFEAAQEYARYVVETTGSVQKLLIAEVVKC